ncbi:unnamed protein product [Ixodes pacificus]
MFQQCGNGSGEIKCLFTFLHYSAPACPFRWSQSRFVNWHERSTKPSPASPTLTPFCERPAPTWLWLKSSRHEPTWPGESYANNTVLVHFVVSKKGLSYFTSALLFCSRT